MCDSTAASVKSGEQRDWGLFWDHWNRISTLYLVTPDPQTSPHKLSNDVAFPGQPAAGPPQITFLFSELDQTSHCHPVASGGGVTTKSGSFWAQGSGTASDHTNPVSAPFWALLPLLLNSGERSRPDRCSPPGKTPVQQHSVSYLTSLPCSRSWDLDLKNKVIS